MAGVFESGRGQGKIIHADRKDTGNKIIGERERAAGDLASSRTFYHAPLSYPYGHEDAIEAFDGNNGSKNKGL
jgi:hypothetical protein